jgi:hypothetical protein
MVNVYTQNSKSDNQNHPDDAVAVSNFLIDLSQRVANAISGKLKFQDILFSGFQNIT